MFRPIFGSLAINKTGSSSLWAWMDGYKAPYLGQSGSGGRRQHCTPAPRASVAATFRRDDELFGYDVDSGP